MGTGGRVFRTPHSTAKMGFYQHWRKVFEKPLKGTRVRPQLRDVKITYITFHYQTIWIITPHTKRYESKHFDQLFFFSFVLGNKQPVWNPSPSHNFQKPPKKLPAWLIKTHSQWQHYECWVQVQSLWNVARVLDRSPAKFTHIQQIMHTPYRWQEFSWKQYDFRNDSTFSVQFTEKRATERKSKQQSLKNRSFYPSKQVCHRSLGWLKFPRKMHF